MKCLEIFFVVELNEYISITENLTENLNRHIAIFKIFKTLKISEYFKIYMKKTFKLNSSCFIL